MRNKLGGGGRGDMRDFGAKGDGVAKDTVAGTRNAEDGAAKRLFSGGS